MDKSTQKQQSASNLIEEKLVAFAEQLGGFVGTVQAKAEGWLDRSALTKEIGRIRDSAADLLAHMNRDALQRKTPAERTATSAPTLPAFLYSTVPPVPVVLKTAASILGFPDTGLSEPSKREV